MVAGWLGTWSKHPSLSLSLPVPHRFSHMALSLTTDLWKVDTASPLRSHREGETLLYAKWLRLFSPQCLTDSSLDGMANISEQYLVSGDGCPSPTIWRALVLRGNGGARVGTDQVTISEKNFCQSYCSIWTQTTVISLVDVHGIAAWWTSTNKAFTGLYERHFMLPWDWPSLSLSAAYIQLYACCVHDLLIFWVQVIG